MLTDLLQDFGEVSVVVPHPFLYEMKVIIFTFLACLGLQTILDSVCFLAQYIHGPTQPVFITALCLLFMALRAGTGVQFFPSPWLPRASPLPWSRREVSKGESRCEVSLHLCMGHMLVICNLATARWELAGAPIQCRPSNILQ